MHSAKDSKKKVSRTLQKILRLSDGLLTSLHFVHIEPKIDT
jgi:hypothetical protein